MDPEHSVGLRPSGSAGVLVAPVGGGGVGWMLWLRADSE
jgi:hypothetical protein